MKLKLLRNVFCPDGGGYEGDIVFSPPLPEALAQDLVRRGYAQQLPEATTEPTTAPTTEATPATPAAPVKGTATAAHDVTVKEA